MSPAMPSVPSWQILLVIFWLGAFCCCTKLPQPPSAGPFINRGPLPVSRDNPHIGTNRFLAGHADLDPNLKGFLSAEGLPDALEVRTLSGQPIQVHLFYIERGHRFRMVEGEHGWTVFAAEPISKNSLSALAGVAAIAEKHPALGTAKKAALPSSSGSKTTQDVVHTVGELGETLQTIAERYTGSHEAVGTLARINGLDPIAILQVGTAVRIPNYLVPEKARPAAEPPVNADAE